VNRGHLAIIMPDLRGGGAERVAVNLANSFSQRGYTVDMVLLSVTGEFLADLSPEISIIDLNAKRLRWALPALIRYLRKSSPSAVLANMWPLTVIAIWARALSRSRTRVVVVEHTTWSRDEIASTVLGRYKVSLTMNCFFAHADKIVSVSQAAADDLEHFANLDKNSVDVIYNPIVGDERLSSSDLILENDWWSGSHRRILAVGSLSKIKDYTTMLVAFAHLRKLVDARLLILGEGSCRLEMEALAKELNIEGSVFMPGFVKNPSPYFQHADLHVLSSTGEGFGNVIVEALFAGIPVVSTDCHSGPREILGDGKFGRLVPVGDAVALAKAMSDSLAESHDHLALKERALEFSITKAVDHYEGLLFPNCCRT